MSQIYGAQFGDSNCVNFFHLGLYCLDMDVMHLKHV
jgi:hypothetical protein